MPDIDHTHTYVRTHAVASCISHFHLLVSGNFVWRCPKIQHADATDAVHVRDGKKVEHVFTKCELPYLV